MKGVLGYLLRDECSDRFDRVNVAFEGQPVIGKGHSDARNAKLHTERSRGRQTVSGSQLASQDHSSKLLENLGLEAEFGFRIDFDWQLKQRSPSKRNKANDQFWREHHVARRSLSQFSRR
jgi:hypothetical protein